MGVGELFYEIDIAKEDIRIPHGGGGTLVHYRIFKFPLQAGQKAMPTNSTLLRQDDEYTGCVQQNWNLLAAPTGKQGSPGGRRIQ